MQNVVDLQLAPFAVSELQSRGRAHCEPAPSWRNEFQRDRDRVIHCSAFRRLEYKTQVFVNHEGDMFRTRLTHSLEVAQIARTVARALRVNEDLTEAIALAHDLGHTPFGHAGQTALNSCMSAFGGFEHNLQSLRVVDTLERRYPAFDGLNLLFETREGILKHCKAENAVNLGLVGQRFLEGKQASVEAQVANIADEIAYNHHDIEDGLRSGILSLEQIGEHELFRCSLNESVTLHDDLKGKRLISTAIRAMLGTFANDLITTSARRLARSRCETVEDVRNYGDLIVGFSPTVREQHLRLKRLLHRQLYSDARVEGFTQAAAATVGDLFGIYFDRPELLGIERAPPRGSNNTMLARAIADYIAGMTDRFAIAEHRRLFQISHWPD